MCRGEFNVLRVFDENPVVVRTDSLDTFKTDVLAVDDFDSTDRIVMDCCCIASLTGCVSPKALMSADDLP